MSVDPAITTLLDVDPSRTSVAGNSLSFIRPNKLVIKTDDGATAYYFLKLVSGSSAAAEVAGAHASLSAIHDIVPTLCPHSHGYGQLQNTKDAFFLVTDWIESTSSSTARANGASTLAKKLAKLHSTPAPIPPGYSRLQFGFPVPTSCGATAQDNTFTSSWAEFYADRRLRFIVSQSRKANGADAKLEALVEMVCNRVVDRLIGDDKHAVTPVLVHGDLWTGNTSRGKLPGMREAEDVVFDSSACYAHSEFELGIMRMFGGFGAEFMREYHGLVPKMEPTGEYEDRVALYELYHQLNHHALFGHGYRTHRNAAVRIMEDLIAKYG